LFDRSPSSHHNLTLCHPAHPCPIRATENNAARDLYSPDRRTFSVRDLFFIFRPGPPTRARQGPKTDCFVTSSLSLAVTRRRVYLSVCLYFSLPQTASGSTPSSEKRYFARVPFPFYRQLFIYPVPPPVRSRQKRRNDISVARDDYCPATAAEFVYDVRATPVDVLNCAWNPCGDRYTTSSACLEKFSSDKRSDVAYTRDWLARRLVRNTRPPKGGGRGGRRRKSG